MTSHQGGRFFVVITDDEHGPGVDGPFACRHEARDFILSVLNDMWHDGHPDEDFPYNEREAMDELECWMSIHALTMSEGFQFKEDK